MRQNVLLEGYEILHEIGRGAQGVVHLAHPTNDSNNRVVIKEIFSKARIKGCSFGTSTFSLNASDNKAADLKSEIAILASLQHPNVVSFLESGSYHDEDGIEILLIAMEYANSGNLHEYLANDSFPIHHRDLKSHNVLLHRSALTGAITLKLADFGISRLSSGNQAIVGPVVGTPNYLAPELCSGEPCQLKSDIWALGCILYEIATRCLMFDGPNLLAIIDKITRLQFKPIDNFPHMAPEWFCKLLAQLMVTEPSERLSMVDIVAMPEMQVPIFHVFFHEYVSEEDEYVLCPSPNVGSTTADARNLPDSVATVDAGVQQD